MNGHTLIFAILCAGASAQIFLSQPIPLARQEASLAHPAVVENAINEAHYPSEYKNRVYNNPHVAEALAKESWFSDKEMPVFDRAADKIPRDRIAKIFKDAGFVRRR
ncbi:uncharacterized protein LOC129776731 [Toxorhynchites rutilus septentrionalis]|uniref:uncharacterized protein LOC129776731 n=1 Tax=Toxorhynchites rutilus septentrionalis TaxID=329112 RepID=UPI00247A918A|nr:uncharacterized protein LOC129776731 [Toxorhynchites rutilus septentrionalis]XP_055638523.1 uncharacterized protein LOC129776731 [Toxorhynchites rutilus septentrionalis]XP_055638524.1 uncharacterized protein LOC129776731 [Toxorhynchites rutilus septentrionalis]XP_055638525.1 uncharacterized protein LOC129776731 [Toxorhynchites rutilus septentrionalis]